MLTEIACRNAKPREREYKLSDSGGLYLLVTPAGGKLWRWKYRIVGRERKLALGKFPAVSLAAARRARDAARVELDAGNDPSQAKRRRRIVAAGEALDSFEKVARAWHASWQATRSPRYAAAVLSRLEANAFPLLGRLPVRTIDAPLVLAAIRAVEQRGAPKMAHKVREHMSDVFVWAIGAGLASEDPAATVRKALAATTARLRPALRLVEDARALIAATEALPGAFHSTLLASRLLALTAVRPSVARMAEAGEFRDLDGPEPLWLVPAAKMKLRQAQKADAAWDFAIPLSRQAADVARAAIAASAACQAETAENRWLFPGPARWTAPISDATLGKLYRLADPERRHVPHGWRATFSTVMNERAALAGRDSDRAIIDLMLAHVKGDVEAAYNRAAYLPRRRELSQDWADLLTEGLSGPETLLPEVRPWRARSEPAGERRRTEARRQRDR